MSASIIYLYPREAEPHPNEPQCSGCGAEPATPDPDGVGCWCDQCADLNGGAAA